eukprot:69941-Hanusia_phi.AAC.3
MRSWWRSREERGREERELFSLGEETNEQDAEPADKTPLMASAKILRGGGGERRFSFQMGPAMLVATFTICNLMNYIDRG